MTQKYWEQPPTSFTDTVELVKNYVRAEIVREAAHKQLYYHNLDHALAVERRALSIFQAIKPALLANSSLPQLTRLESLLSVCGLAHDMVQIFEPVRLNQTRRRQSGLSEAETAHKLIRYINCLNSALSEAQLDLSLQFSFAEKQIIRDGIMATVCIPDPQGGRSKATSATGSIYQPYLYQLQPQTSIVGQIIALADLGALGIDGVEVYLRDGILIFLEDNPHLRSPIFNYSNSQCSSSQAGISHNWSYIQNHELETKLLNMTRFIVDFARERLARFEPEIASFSPPVRQILRDRVFIYLNQESISLAKRKIPHHADATLAELTSFFADSKV